MSTDEIERWLATKWGDTPESRLPYAVKCADFLLGLVAFHRTERERLLGLLRELGRDSRAVASEIERTRFEIINTVEVAYTVRKSVRREAKPQPKTGGHK